VHFITVAVRDRDRLGDDKVTDKYPRRTGIGGWQQAVRPIDYADDIALIETSQMGVQLMTEEVEKISRRVGLRMNAGKCKIVVSNNWEDSTVITAEGTNVEVVKDFCYLGQLLIENRKLHVTRNA